MGILETLLMWLLGMVVLTVAGFVKWVSVIAACACVYGAWWLLVRCMRCMR